MINLIHELFTWVFWGFHPWSHGKEPILSTLKSVWMFILQKNKLKKTNKKKNFLLAVVSQKTYFAICF